MTEIDILLPCYGNAVLVSMAVASVVAQTDANWHLTVVDDASPTSDIELLVSEMRHPQVTYIRNPQNLGVNANFQNCLDLATRDHFVIMGADDLLLPSFVRGASEAIREFPHASAIQPGVKVIDASGRVVDPLTDRVKRLLRPEPGPTGSRLLGGEPLATSLLRGNWTYFPSIIWKRSAAQPIGFRSGLDVALDLGLLLDLVMRGGTLLLLEEVLFLYRRHAESASSAGAHRGERFAEERAFFTDAAQACDQRGWRSAARSSRLHAASRLHALALAPAAVRQRRIGTAARLIRHGLV